MKSLDWASLHSLEDLPPHTPPTSLDDDDSLGWAAACWLTILPTTLQYDVYFTHSGELPGSIWHVCLPLLVQINFIFASVHFLQPNQSLFICKYSSSKCIAFIRVCLTKLIQIPASHCFFHPNISYFIYGSAFPNAPCGPNSYCVQEKYGYYG